MKGAVLTNNIDYIIIVIITFLISVSLIPLIIRICTILNLFDSINERKIHKGNIPRLGGVAIALSFMLGILFLFLFSHKFSYEGTRLFPLLLAGVIVFVFGVIDDIFDLKAVAKLAAQLIATTLIASVGFRFKYILGYEIPYSISVLLTFCWTFGMINSFNLIDGLDGLCGGLSTLIFITMGIINILAGGSGIIYFVLSASILGFLVFNYPPAKIFMGDCGSQLLGFFIAVIPLYEDIPSIAENKFFMITVLVSIPYMDVVAAIWRRIRDHKPVMSADRFHIHHKLLNLGLSKKQILHLLLIEEAFICTIVIISILCSKKTQTIIYATLTIFQILLFFLLHYLHYYKYLKKQTDIAPLTSNANNL